MNQSNLNLVKLTYKLITRQTMVTLKLYGNDKQHIRVLVQVTAITMNIE